MAGVVTVACKLPNGLHLDIPSKDGMPPKRVTVRGWALEAPGDPRPRFRSEGGVVHYESPGAPLVANGYALTSDVPEEHWNAWLDANQHSKLVTGGFIFAYPKAENAQARAREMAKAKTGLEPVDPNSPGDKLERVTL